MSPALFRLPAETVDGIFTAGYTDQGLAELNWPSVSRAPSRPAQKPVFTAQVRSWHRLTESALKAALAGRGVRQLPPLDWTGATEFQKAVWRVLLKLAPGRTRSYGEVAVAIGRPRAVRAVGGACGANPIPVLVPCHRVLAAGRKMGGFSGGLEWKRRLLAREGVPV